jgi:hypothetical protein
VRRGGVDNLLNFRAEKVRDNAARQRMSAETKERLPQHVRNRVEIEPPVEAVAAVQLLVAAKLERRLRQLQAGANLFGIDKMHGAVAVGVAREVAAVRLLARVVDKTLLIVRDKFDVIGCIDGKHLRMIFVE